MHDYMVSCILLLHLALCFFPTVRESIRKDPRPIFGSQPTGRGPVLSISPTHMCLATHFISCIIHKHTHNFCALSSTSAFALQNPHAVQRCMAFSASPPPMWPGRNRMRGKRYVGTEYLQGTKKEHRKRERCREGVDRCSESLRSAQ